MKNNINRAEAQTESEPNVSSSPALVAGNESTLGENTPPLPASGAAPCSPSGDVFREVKGMRKLGAFIANNKSEQELHHSGSDTIINVIIGEKAYAYLYDKDTREIQGSITFASRHLDGRLDMYARITNNLIKEYGGIKENQRVCVSLKNQQELCSEWANLLQLESHYQEHHNVPQDESP